MAKISNTPNAVTQNTNIRKTERARVQNAAMNQARSGREAEAPSPYQKGDEVFNINTNAVAEQNQVKEEVANKFERFITSERGSEKAARQGAIVTKEPGTPAKVEKPQAQAQAQENRQTRERKQVQAHKRVGQATANQDSNVDKEARPKTQEMAQKKVQKRQEVREEKKIQVKEQKQERIQEKKEEKKIVKAEEQKKTEVKEEVKEKVVEEETKKEVVEKKSEKRMKKLKPKEVSQTASTEIDLETAELLLEAAEAQLAQPALSNVGQKTVQVQSKVSSEKTLSTAPQDLRKAASQIESQDMEAATRLRKAADSIEQRQIQHQARNRKQNRNREQKKTTESNVHTDIQAKETKKMEDLAARMANQT